MTNSLSSNLVTRLRDAAHIAGGQPAFPYWPAMSLCTEAADALAAKDARIAELVAALQAISQDEFSVVYDAGGDAFDDDYWRVVNIARAALKETP
jgi:hypothetical protein